MTRELPRELFPAFLLVIAAFQFFAGCGLFSGSGANFNDSVPAGTILCSSQLLGSNGTGGVSGMVEIYKNSSTYTLRLDGISTPSKAGAQISLRCDGNTVLTQSLRSATGSQNYSISSATGSCTLSLIMSGTTQYAEAVLNNCH